LRRAACHQPINNEHFFAPAVALAEADMMTTEKLQFYTTEAEKCRRLAADESCADAREYYEALGRDYAKLAALEAQKRSELTAEGSNA
jgi:hypothetical protein